MQTSAEAINQLTDSLNAAKKAADTIENLIATHDYQDVAMLVTLAATKMLESATLMMQKDPEAALDALDSADDFVEEVFKIINEDTDEE